MDYTPIIEFIVFSLLPRIILTISIIYYDKSRGIEKKTSSYVLAFIFGIFYIIARVIKKKGTRTDSPDKTYKNRSIALFVIYVLLLVGSYTYSYIDANFADHYFDRNGNGYNGRYDVVYYTENGTGYVIDLDEFCLVDVDNSANKVEVSNGYLDKAGYLVFIDAETLEYDEKASFYDPYCFYDADNNYYADPMTSYWNEEGELVEFGSGPLVVNDFIEKLKPYIDKLIEKQNNQG